MDPRLPEGGSATGYSTPVPGWAGSGSPRPGGWMTYDSNAGDHLLLSPAATEMIQNLNQSSGSSNCWSSARSEMSVVSAGAGLQGGLDTFLVTLSCSRTSSAHSRETTSEGGSLDATIAQFRARCQRKISPLLPRPIKTRNKRRRRTPPATVRRSNRLEGRLASGSSIKTQQRTVMVQLGIAREGEVIENEAMQAYLDLFSRPLQPSHIAAIVGLFGWQAEVLPLGRGMDAAALSVAAAVA